MGSHFKIGLLAQIAQHQTQQTTFTWKQILNLTVTPLRKVLVSFRHTHTVKNSFLKTRGLDYIN
jgi:hypothetical protein